jgi:Flp pilus assembly protein TadG
MHGIQTLVERDMCGTFSRLRARRDQGGAAAVEFALIMVPLLYLVFGLIQYGWYFYAMQSGSSAVGDAARRVAVGNCQTSTQVQQLIYDHLGSATSASTASGVTTTVTYTKADGSGSVAAPGEIGGAVTITATFPTLNLHFPFIPVPNDGSITRTNVTRIEDLASTQGTCS